MNKILISAYDGKKEADSLEKLCIKAKLKSEQFIVRHRYLHESQDFGITLSNRSGSMQNAEYKIASLKEPLKNPVLFLLILFLDYQGDVLICPHDWGKRLFWAILAISHLVKFGLVKAMKIRKMLNNSNRNFSPCNVCDVDGTLMGKRIQPISNLLCLLALHRKKLLIFQKI